MEIKKVLFVTYKMSDGGAERVISVLANELCKLNYKVTVFIYKRTEKEYPLDKKVCVVSFDEKYSENQGSPVLRKIQRIRALRNTICAENPDVVIPFLDSMVCESYFALYNTSIPIIGTVRNNPQKARSISKVQRDFVLKRCVAIYMQTEKQKEYFSPVAW